MKTSSRPNRAGFTLIELMAVITIIVILAGLVVGGLGYVNEKQARSKAQVQIQLLSKALEEYKLDFGYYPESGNTTSGTGKSSILYTKLFFEGYQASTGVADTTGLRATRIYLPDLDPRYSKQGWVTTTTATVPTANLPVNDPWGFEYRYRTARQINGTANAATINPDFDLWSAGKDNASTPGSPAATNNRDDVTNF